MKKMEQNSVETAKNGAFSASETEKVPRRLCIVSGLSGAGKSTALRAFEDLGFFAVDGLPATLAPEMAALIQKPDMDIYKGMAIGMDLRQANFLQELNLALFNLSSHGMSVSLIFLEASNEDLLKRYAATRRPHPMELHGISLINAIAKERKELLPLREMADLVIDTTNYSVHDLRRAIRSHYLEKHKDLKGLRLIILSFGFRFGIPNDADFVFDLRFLPNPYFVEELKQFSGLDQEVMDYVFQSGAANIFLEKILDMLEFVLPRMELDGRSRVTIALGCTGGRHRSVAFAEKLAGLLALEHYSIMLEHRTLNDKRALEAVA